MTPSVMMNHVQQHGGKAVYIGIGTDISQPVHNHPGFDFDEDCLEPSVSLLSLMLKRLSLKSSPVKKEYISHCILKGRLLGVLTCFHGFKGPAQQIIPAPSRGISAPLVITSRSQPAANRLSLNFFFRDLSSMSLQLLDRTHESCRSDEPRQFVAGEQDLFHLVLRFHIRT